MQAERLLELATEGYYRSSFYRLGALRLIEVPLYAYQAATRAGWEENQAIAGAEETQNGSRSRGA